MLGIPLGSIPILGTRKALQPPAEFVGDHEGVIPGLLPESIPKASCSGKLGKHSLEDPLALLDVLASRPIRLKQRSSQIVRRFAFIKTVVDGFTLGAIER